MSIKKCVFALESIAHLQGKEAELLPLVEAAREELRSLSTLVVAANQLVVECPQQLALDENEALFGVIEALGELK